MLGAFNLTLLLYDDVVNSVLCIRRLIFQINSMFYETLIISIHILSSNETTKNFMNYEANINFFLSHFFIIHKSASIEKASGLKLLKQNKTSKKLDEIWIISEKAHLRDVSTEVLSILLPYITNKEAIWDLHKGFKEYDVAWHQRA